MPKFELSKSVDAVKVNKRSGIPTGDRITLAFGAILTDPYEDRDTLRFTYLGELYQAAQSELHGYMKQIDAPEPKGPAAGVATAAVAASSAAPVTYKLHWEKLSSAIAASRAKVPGGWLVTVAQGVTFVPDAAHAWDGSSAE